MLCKCCAWGHCLPCLTLGLAHPAHETPTVKLGDATNADDEWNNKIKCFSGETLQVLSAWPTRTVRECGGVSSEYARDDGRAKHEKWRWNLVVCPGKHRHRGIGREKLVPQGDRDVWGWKEGQGQLLDAWVATRRNWKHPCSQSFHDASALSLPLSALRSHLLDHEAVTQ